MTSDDYTYAIGYDLDLDVWNWCDAAHVGSHGYDWRSNLTNDDDIELFDRIAVMSEKDATEYLYKELPKLHKDRKDHYDKRQAEFTEAFDEKFIDACSALEKITGKKLYYQDYKIKLTTFPKGPYNFEEGSFGYCYDNPNPLVKTFMHEALHFQFIAYWHNNPNSPISKLPHNQFVMLNESLTVVLDGDLKNIIGSPDQGYMLYKELRGTLHAEWKKHHDFDKLVDYGLKKLPDFVVK